MTNRICLNCGVELKHYDFVSRIVRKQNRQSEYVKVERFQCPVCKHIHRMLPDYIYPFKQYEADIIHGVLDGSITSDILEYEDYPSEMTMKRWLDEFH